MDVDTMKDDQIQVRIKRSVWDRIKELADGQEVSGTKMLEDVLDGRVVVPIGQTLVAEIHRLQDYCARNDSALVEYFEHDGDDEYGWLKDKMERTLEVIENIETMDYDE